MLAYGNTYLLLVDSTTPFFPVGTTVVLGPSVGSFCNATWCFDSYIGEVEFVLTNTSDIATWNANY